MQARADGAQRRRERRSAEKKRRPKGEIRAWNADQLQAFLTAAKNERLFAAFWLAANTAMRRSEVLGLRWSDTDLATAHLSVNQALVSVAYELHESRGKTRNSSRWVDLDMATVTVLEALARRSRNGARSQRHGR